MVESREQHISWDLAFTCGRIVCDYLKGIRTYEDMEVKIAFLILEHSDVVFKVAVSKPVEKT